MTYPPLWPAAIEARIRAEARNLDPQKVPDHVQMCTKCVITNQRPRITFDADGVCSACRYWERKRTDIDWGAREQLLRALLEKHRRKSGYDVIVPASGGKDSSMVAHRLKHEYGMHPLLVKFPPFIYTDIGKKNWESLKAHGFDAVEARVHELTHRRFARVCLEYLGDPFDPFVWGQLAYPMRVADDLRIGLVMYGENGEAEYGGDTAANDRPCWEKKDRDRVYQKGEDYRRVYDWFGAELVEDSSPYWQPDFMPDEEPQFHWFGYYRSWHPMENFYYAQEHCGFEPNPERSEGTYSRFASLDDRLDGDHYWFSWLKFGIGRTTSDAAQQVRAGDLTRDEALALVAKFDGEFPRKYWHERLDYLGLDEDQYFRIVERFCRKGLDWRAKVANSGETVPRQRYA